MPEFTVQPLFHSATVAAHDPVAMNEARRRLGDKIAYEYAESAGNLWAIELK